LKDLCVDGRIILKWAFEEIRWENKGWIDLSQDMDKWWAFLNMVMNLQVS